LLVTALVVSLLPPVALFRPPAAHAAADVPGRPCADMTVLEENPSSIRLRVDQPAGGAQAAVDEQGHIAISGILHEEASMVDVSDGDVTSTDFVLGSPPEDVAAWAEAWSTSLRPPHLGANTVCVRAVRDQRSARIRRSFTVVDLIPPSAVPVLAVSNITATGAEVTWGAATDNYGLAGYAVSVDGATAQRTTVGTRSYTITGLAPATHHTVSVVAIDLGGNTSTPSTADFTTAAAPPPPPPGDLTFNPEQGAATVAWHPDPADVTYRAFLDGQPFPEFPPGQYCQDATGNPASPCTPQDVISYPITPLEEGTPYTFRVDALRDDGTVSRSLSGSFTTTVGPALVPPAMVQQIASESSQCAGMGGHFYVSPSMRGRVPVPAGSTQLFAGCYTVANNSCLDAFLPPSGDKLLNCADDVTRLLFTVAPAGHGPVISALDGVVDYGGTPAAFGPFAVAPPPVEPITWCTEGACTVVIEAAAEAAESVAIEVAAGATVAPILVIGGVIGIALVLAVLLTFLFPTELGIAGILEYPIDFFTNFDTFDNWGADKGQWYDSLKIYAEVVKTTTQLASQQNIPFAWDSDKDARLKLTIDRPESASRAGDTRGWLVVGVPVACDDRVDWA
jgi:hypothetical protein